MKTTLFLLMTFHLSIFYAQAPTNDDFANATAVTCSMNYMGSTVNATLDEDDAPDGEFVDIDTANVWYSYTGNGTSEIIQLDLCGTNENFDTTLVVFTGTSGNLTIVADNDDGEQCEDSQSFAVFNSDGTTTYYIAVSGYDGDQGAYDLSVTCVSPAVNDNFENAIALSCGSTYSENTVNASLDQEDAPDGDEVITNTANVWYSYTGTGTSEMIELDMCNTVATFDTTLVVFTETSGNLTVVADNDDGLDCEDSQSKLTFESDGTTTYYVSVAGYDGSLGTFNLDVSCSEVLDVNDYNDVKISYYPNPVTSILTFNTEAELQAIQLYNVSGKRITFEHNAYDLTSKTIDMSSLQSGLYFADVKYNNTIKTIRVIKN